ncbi:MAG: hypothetical protein WCK82_08360 [Bacteroidota bacterium]
MNVEIGQKVEVTEAKPSYDIKFGRRVKNGKYWVKIRVGTVAELDGAGRVRVKWSHIEYPQGNGFYGNRREDTKRTWISLKTKGLKIS